MNVLKQAALNMDIEDTVRKLHDEEVDLLANLSVMLTPDAQRIVRAEVARRLREMRS